MNDQEKLKSFSYLQTRYQFLSQGCLVFSFTLPICLHLDSNTDFLVNLHGWSSPFVINTEEYIEEYDPRYGNARNAEVNSDISSAFRFTRMNVIFQDINRGIPLDKTLELYQKDTLKAVNHFLNAYRYLTKRNAINNIFSLYATRSLKIYRVDQKGKEEFEIIINFGTDGALSPFLPLRSIEEHKKLHELISQDSLIPLEELFLMDAKRYAIIGYELQSLITGVIALEASIGKKGKKKASLQSWVLNLFLRYDSLQSEVERLLNNNPNTPKSLIGDVIFAIRERNRVIHNGKTFIDGDIRKHLESIESAIKYIKNS